MFYEFTKGLTDKYLKSTGRRPRDVEEGFVTIEEVDFSKKLNLGEAELTEDEAFVLDGAGNKQPVFFYKKAYFFFYHSEERGTPKFHIRKCAAVKEHGVADYVASNTKTVTVQNRNRYKGERSYRLRLSICGRCRREINNPPETTEEFYDRLRKRFQTQQEGREEIKTDLNGYPLDWNQISRKYRETVNYTCENPKCGIKLDNDWRFMHTHHKNGIKKDIRDENLECLCILCHYYQNERHIANFEKGRLKKDLEEFVRKYRGQLEGGGNPFLKGFLRRNER